MVQLKPEIYQMIVESMRATDEPPDFETRSDQQQCLARMMQASKLLCAICEPYLYKDCLVGDINLFVQDLEPKSRKESLLNRVTTLRLYHPLDHCYDEPSYKELVRDEKWKDSGMKSGVQDHQGHIRRAHKDKEYADSLWNRGAADKLNSAITNGDMVGARRLRASIPHSFVDETPLEDQSFYRLERVIMTGAGDQSWGQPADYSLPFDAIPELSFHYYHNGYPRSLDPRPIPNFIIALESVRHYCQTCNAGPLALNNEIYRLANVPETVTFHVNNPSTTNDSVLPPIVLGTVNRYVFNSPQIMITDGNGDVMDYDTVKDFLNPIIVMLQARDRTLCVFPRGYGFDLSGEDHPQFASTRIELYDLARHIDGDRVIARGGAKMGMGQSNLKGTQEQLDRRIGGWKGKVFLKNLEDMSPCPACGMKGSGGSTVGKTSIRQSRGNAYCDSTSDE